MRLPIGEQLLPHGPWRGAAWPRAAMSSVASPRLAREHGFLRRSRLPAAAAAPRRNARRRTTRFDPTPVSASLQIPYPASRSRARQSGRRSPRESAGCCRCGSLVSDEPRRSPRKLVMAGIATLSRSCPPPEGRAAAPRGQSARAVRACARHSPATSSWPRAVRSSPRSMLVDARRCAHHKRHLHTNSVEQQQCRECQPSRQSARARATSLPAAAAGGISSAASSSRPRASAPATRRGMRPARRSALAHGRRRARPVAGGRDSCCRRARRVNSRATKRPLAGAARRSCSAGGWR